MSKKMVFRWISLGMLAVAAVFVTVALCNPQLGSTFYICGIPIGAELWRVGYGLYVLVMAGLFAASFFTERH